MTALSIKSKLGNYFAKGARMVQITKTVDCTVVPLASGNTYVLTTIPKGFVLVQRDVVLLTAEGGTATIDIGYSGGTDYINDGGNLNGTPNARLADGTNASNLTAGKYFSAATDVILTPNNNLAACKFVVTLLGYRID